MERRGDSWTKALLAGVLGTLALFAAARADAADLYTPVVRSNGSSVATYMCVFTNIGTKPMADVSLTLWNDSHGVPNANTFAVPAGQTVTLSVGGAAASGVRCQASGKISKSKVLMTMQLLSGTTGATLVAVPMQ